MIFFSFQMEAQDTKPKQDGKLVKTIYYYQFEGAKSLEEVNSLRSEIYALKGVTEFKPVYKAEKNMGQVIVVVTEKARTSEGETFFEITDLKKLLEQKGYKNLEFTYEETAVK